MAKTFEELLAMVKKAKTGKEWGDIIERELPLAPSTPEPEDASACAIPPKQKKIRISSLHSSSTHREGQSGVPISDLGASKDSPDSDPSN